MTDLIFIVRKLYSTGWTCCTWNKVSAVEIDKGTDYPITELF